MPTNEHFPDDAIMAMFDCALRFDGYKYEQEAGLADPVVTGKGLSDLTDPVLETLIFYGNEVANLAVFFWLQRHFKWSDDTLTQDSREHVVFDLLFLHLYRAEVPERYRNEEYCSRWEREHKDSSEELAAMVRSTFSRSLRG